MKVEPMSKVDKAELMNSQALYLGLMKLQTLCTWFELKYFQKQWILTAWSNGNEFIVVWKDTPATAVSYALRLIEDKP